MSDVTDTPTPERGEAYDADDEHNLGDLGHQALYVALERAKDNKTGVMLSWQIANGILRGYAKAKQNRDALRAECARKDAEIDALRVRVEEAERERDEVVAACRGTQMDEAAIASMWSYVREKIGIQAERDALRDNQELMQDRITAYEMALVQYANSINWMTHTDDSDDSIRRVWVGSDDGRYYAREALEDGTSYEMDSMADFYAVHPPHSRDGII